MKQNKTTACMSTKELYELQIEMNDKSIKQLEKIRLMMKLYSLNTIEIEGRLLSLSRQNERFNELVKML